MKILLRLIAVALVLTACTRRSPTLEYINVPYDSVTFWAISAIDDNAAWVVGSKGTVGRTTDGGKTWTFGRIGGFEKREFRSIYAHSDLVAVVANVGSPA